MREELDRNGWKEDDTNSSNKFSFAQQKFKEIHTKPEDASGPGWKAAVNGQHSVSISYNIASNAIPPVNATQLYALDEMNEIAIYVYYLHQVYCHSARCIAGDYSSRMVFLVTDMLIGLGLLQQMTMQFHQHIHSPFTCIRSSSSSVFAAETCYIHPRQRSTL